MAKRKEMVKRKNFKPNYKNKKRFFYKKKRRYVPKPAEFIAQKFTRFKTKYINRRKLARQKYKRAFGLRSYLRSTRQFLFFKKLLRVDLKNYLKKKLFTKNIKKRNFFIIQLVNKLKSKVFFLKNNLIKKYFIKRAFIRKFLKIKPVTKKSIIAKKFRIFKKQTKRKEYIKIFAQKRFKTFLKKNNLYNTFNLRQDFPYPNFLQSKSEIQRANVFRDLVHKEEAYYKAISKSPLIILLSPKPKNIYMTVYTVPESKNGYQILWKKSTGMLEKVEGQLSFAALVELFNKLNIFLAKEYLDFQNPIRLIIKSTKYYGTNHLIQNFVKMFQKNMDLNNIYYMYKYRKRFEFFNNHARLINDSVFNYISSIWLKFLKLLRRTKLAPHNAFTFADFKSFNKFFGIEYDYLRRRHRINHFTRLKRLKSLKKKDFLKPRKKILKKKFKISLNHSLNLFFKNYAKNSKKTVKKTVQKTVKKTVQKTVQKKVIKKVIKKNKKIQNNVRHR